jgi:hypothetical protein
MAAVLIGPTTKTKPKNKWGKQTEVILLSDYSLKEYSAPGS